MKFTTKAISVSALALALAALPALATNIGSGAAQPVYSPATMVEVNGTITAVRQVAAGGAMPGMHLTVAAKSGTFDVYLAPADFMKIFKTSFPVGKAVTVLGSRVNFQNSPVILTNEVSIGATDITLRDGSGAPVWENWGVELGS
jgi:hypothetical protein